MRISDWSSDVCSSDLKRHGFCANCGKATHTIKAGWARKCSGCEAEHFPRVDPVVIMLAEYDGKILVGRQPRFPAGRYSALAGFVEPGESIEEAVARELWEGAGIRVHSVRYGVRSEEHTSELQSLMRISYAVFCLKKKNIP